MVDTHGARFNEEGKVFTCYNCYNSCKLALPTTPQPFPSEGDILPRRTRRINLLHERYPFLPFVLVIPSTFGPILSRFALVEEMVVQDHNGWHLRRDAQLSWFRMGNAVRGCTEHLWEHCTTRPVDMSLPECAAPEKHGYLNNFHSRDDAIARAKESRDALYLLFAMLTFVVAFYKYSRPSELIDVHGTPEWCRQLLLKDVSTSWLDDLQNSQILDFSCRRVGLIIDFNMVIRKDRMADILKVYIRAGIPVYIDWGCNLKLMCGSHFFKEFRPSLSQFTSTKDDYRRWRESSNNLNSRSEISE